MKACTYLFGRSQGMGPHMKNRMALLIMLTPMALAGCNGKAGTHDSAYGPMEAGARNTIEAQRLTQEAATLMTSDAAKAESLLRQALAADLFHGPAHNNLGVLHLNATPPKLYEAANEFEWACRMMPGHPDPRMNLAMTLEQAGRTDEAIAAYRTALEAYPNHLPTLQALTSLQLRTSRSDDGTHAALHEIALAGTDDVWRNWAKELLLRRK